MKKDWFDLFFTVSSITAIAAVVGLIAIVVICLRYSYALHNFGFAQGDIGTSMFQFADLRSSLRGAIGYDEQSAIDAVTQQHTEMKAAFEQSFQQIEKTIVSEDGRKTYDAIEAELDDYWKLDSEILALGATTDRELCKQAQDLAMSELSVKYNSIYEKLEELLDVKVKEGNKLSGYLMAACWILVGIIIITIAVAMMASMKIGKKISKKISDPLGELGIRLETFAAGDLTSPFPEINTGDEVEEMGKMQYIWQII